MRKTIQELKRENERLKNQVQAKKELIDIQKERNRLLKENKALVAYGKHPQFYEGAKHLGKTSLRFGKIAGKGFMSWAKKVAEADRRSQIAQRKMQTVKRRSSTRTKRRRR
jgi:lysozyme family protein